MLLRKGSLANMIKSHLPFSSILDTVFYCVNLWKKVKVVQSWPTLCGPMNYTVHRILQARILEWVVAFPFSRESSQSRARTQGSSIAGRFFTSWAIGKPKSTGVGNLSLLQGNIPTQELNRGLLQCRQILDHLSYQGSPGVSKLGVHMLMSVKFSSCINLYCYVGSFFGIFKLFILIRG